MCWVACSIAHFKPSKHNICITLICAILDQRQRRYSRRVGHTPSGFFLLRYCQNIQKAKKSNFQSLFYGVRIGPSHPFVVSQVRCVAVSLFCSHNTLVFLFVVSHFRCFAFSHYCCCSVCGTHNVLEML